MTNPTLIEQAITEYWGDRCPETEPGCQCCDAWAEYDALVASRAQSVTGAQVALAKAEFLRWVEGYSGQNGRNETFHICRKDDAGEVVWLDKFTDRDEAIAELDNRRIRAALEAAQLPARPVALPLDDLIRPLEGIDTNQPGYHHAKGWNDAIMHCMDLQRARTPTPTADQPEGDARLHEAAKEAVRNICEWDDRTSPDGYEDYILITPAELEIELFNFAAQTAPTPASGEQMEVVAWITEASLELLRNGRAVKYSDTVPTRQRDHVVPLVLATDAQAHIAALTAKAGELTRERDEAQRREKAWFETHLAHRSACDALGKANGELFSRAYDAEHRAETAEAQLAQCREALEPFGREADKWKGWPDDHRVGLPFGDMDTKVTAGDFRRAATLSNKGSE